MFVLRLIVVTYRTAGPSLSLRVVRSHPVRSTTIFLAWLGALSVSSLWRAGKVFLDELYEASADLGEWYVTRRGATFDPQSRSRRQ
jgi:hypothetical protein